MKTRIIVTLTGIFLFGLSSISGQEMNHDKASGHSASMKNMNTPDAFKKQLSNVLGEYLLLKDAFVASDEAKAETAAKETLKALDAVDMKLLSGDAHMTWMKQQKAIKGNLNGIIQMKGLNMKRSHFSVVSGNLADAINSFGVETNETVYVDYCPTANNKNGGYWLSADKDIRNPYYGDVMLKCGIVKNTLVPTKKP